MLGKVKVKVGPVTSEFSGKVHFVEQDRDEHRAVIDGKGKEARGTGNASATITAQLHDAGDHTRVTVDTDLKVVGKLAQFGSGMLQQVSEKLLGQFVEALEAKLAADKAPPAPQLDGAAPVAAVSGKQPESEPIDLLELAGGDALKKYGPPVFGAFLLAAVLFTLGRLRIARHGRRASLVTAPFLLRGVDIAAFAVALVDRLHAGGVAVSASGPAGFVEVLRRGWPGTRTQLYWAARLTLVNRVEDIAAFDTVFEAVFADAVLGVDPAGAQTQPSLRPPPPTPACPAASKLLLKAVCRGAPCPRR